MAKVKRDARGAIGFALGLTLLGTLVNDLNFAAVLVPIVTALVLYAMYRMPMRDSMIGLIFLALMLPDPNDSIPVPDLKAPFLGAGAALLSHLNAPGRELGISWAVFSVMDLFLVGLLCIGLYRASLGVRTDAFQRTPIPRPLLQLAYISLIGTAWTWIWGIATGGDFSKSLWQLNRVMYLPLIFIISQMSFRGAEDLERLLRVLLIAAGYKALLALYVLAVADLPPNPDTGSTRPQWAVSHQDSILFATAMSTVFVLILERIGGMRRALRLAALMVPLIGLGMWANNRRTAWMQVMLVFITVFLLAKSNPIKRKIQRLLYVATPLVAIYLMLGWSGGGPLFKPVHMLRSVVDAKSDGSSNWRELENFNIRQTAIANPIFGTGYGHGYLEIIQLPPVNYDLEIYCPHNSLLGIWGYAGVIGFTSLTLLWIGGAYFAIRTYHATANPNVRAGALSVIGALVVYIIQCWGDLGLGTWIGVFIVGPGLAIVGKLAVETGEWNGPLELNRERTR